MKNKELYEQKVEDGSLVRYEINEEHNKEMSQIYRIYKGVFNRNPGEFRVAKDVKYYLGGWPSENTPAKAAQIANKIADAYTLLAYVGYEKDLLMHLRARGLDLKPIAEPVDFYNKYLLLEIDWQLDRKRSAVVEENWKELFDYDIPGDPKEILKALLDRACDKQKIICELADEIKIDMGEEVESECEVKVGNYTRAVNLKYKIQKGKDITEIVDKIKKDADDSAESVEIF